MINRLLAKTHETYTLSAILSATSYHHFGRTDHSDMAAGHPRFIPGRMTKEPHISLISPDPVPLSLSSIPYSPLNPSLTRDYRQRHPAILPPYNTETTEFQDTQTTQAAATIRLLSPLDQQTLRDNEGMISVSVATNQKLGKDHSTQLLLDGTQYGQPQTQLNWRLSNIDRGSHTPTSPDTQ